MINNYAATPSMMPVSMPRLPSLPIYFQPHTGGAHGPRPMYPPPLSGAAHGFEPQHGYYQTAPPPPAHVHSSYPEVAPAVIDRNGSMRGRRGGGYVGQRGGSKATGYYRRSSLGQSGDGNDARDEAERRRSTAQSGDGNDARDEVERRRSTAYPELRQKIDDELLRKTMSHPVVAGPWIELEPVSEDDSLVQRPSNLPSQRIENLPTIFHGHIVDSNGPGRGSAPARQLDGATRDGSSSDGHSVSDHRPRHPLEVWIGSIPQDCVEEDLYAVLSQRAEVARVTVIRKGTAPTFAFAMYSTSTPAVQEYCLTIL
jgi:hypothetical protein